MVSLHAITIELNVINGCDDAPLMTKKDSLYILYKKGGEVPSLDLTKELEPTTGLPICDTGVVYKMQND